MSLITPVDLGTNAERAERPGQIPAGAFMRQRERAAACNSLAAQL
jgi:hypothetical protein